MRSKYILHPDEPRLGSTAGTILLVLLMLCILSPIDPVPDSIPGWGRLDDIGAIWGVIATICTMLSPKTPSPTKSDALPRPVLVIHAPRHSRSPRGERRVAAPAVGKSITPNKGDRT